MRFILLVIVVVSLSACNPLFCQTKECAIAMAISAAQQNYSQCQYKSFNYGWTPNGELLKICQQNYEAQMNLLNQSFPVTK